MRKTIANYEITAIMVVIHSLAFIGDCIVRLQKNIAFILIIKIVKYEKDI